jgi:hypothetical protein
VGRLSVLVLLVGGCRASAPPVRVEEAAVEWRALEQEEAAGRAFRRAEEQLKVLERMKIASGAGMRESLVRYSDELALVKGLYDSVMQYRSERWSRAVLERLKYVNELARRTLEESERD